MMTRAIQYKSKKIFLLKLLKKYGIIDLSKIRSDYMDYSRYRNVAEMLDLYKELDGEISQKIEFNKVKPFCAKVCCECCDEYFYVSEVEYRAIKHFLKESNIDVTAYIAESKRQSEQLVAEYPQEWDKLCSSDTKDFQELSDDGALRKFAPCIFLKDGICKIYPVRPIICRLYGISMYYNWCDEIENAIRGMSNGNIDWNVLNARLIDVPYDFKLRIGIDFIMLKNGNQHNAKPFPMFWWFANERISYENID